MSQAYYNRKGQTVEGLRVFKSPQDTANESAVMAILERAWRCEIRSYGGTCEPIDWYAIRAERVVAFLELKSRDHTVARYDTVFLNLRKWVILSQIELGTGCPAFYVVKWLDDLRYVRVSEVDARRMKLGGCSRRVKSATDVEPVIEIPIGQMTQIEQQERI
jgi:hypothetical protein